MKLIKPILPVIATLLFLRFALHPDVGFEVYVVFFIVWSALAYVLEGRK